MNIDTGITSEVLTIKSEIKLIDIFNEIIDKKSNAVFNYINELDIKKDAKIVVIGTYFTEQEWEQKLWYFLQGWRLLYRFFLT